MVGLLDPPSVGSTFVRHLFLRRLTRNALALSAVALLTLSCAHGDGAAPLTAAGPPPDPALVKTTAGLVRGVIATDHRLLAGTPYAAPPVGPLRWQPPAPPVPWPGERDASKLGPRCMQDLATDLEMGKQTEEDCLNLNVWTPPP